MSTVGEQRHHDGGQTSTLDARGLKCPIPVIRLARLAAVGHHGDTIEVLADDPAARTDIPAWARLTGHEVSAQDRGEHTAYIVRLGLTAQRSPQPSPTPKSG